MIRGRKSQGGFSLLGWLIVLALVAFFSSVAFKMIPHYLDYMSMEKIIDSVETDKAAQVSTVGDFFDYVSRGMQVNSIRDMRLEDVLSVKLEDREFQVHLKYEKRESILQNLDLVARFDKEFRIRAP